MAPTSSPTSVGSTVLGASPVATQPTGFDSSRARASLQYVLKHFKASPITMVPLLGMLALRGKPYGLKDHFPFEPLFKLQLPQRMMVKSGRQVSKSTSAAASIVMRAAGETLNILTIMPLFDQVRRISTNYVRPFIRGSIINHLLVDSDFTQGVLQRSFSNGSNLFFSFASIDVERVRSYSADIEWFDEIADISWDFVPIIMECMSASPLAFALYTGTPTTLDNTAEVLWNESSKGEWVTKCPKGHWNMASIQAELSKMIGQHTVVCAKCQTDLNPREGHWYHTAGKENPGFLGYHIPQIIMPMHYASPAKWQTLLAKRDGVGGYTNQKFVNEVLGESADVSVRLISETDLRKASILPVNDFWKACERIRNYPIRVLGVDWGGGGAEEVSFTTVALVGYRGIAGRCECHFAARLHASMSHDEEAKTVLEYFRGASCHYLAHDYCGAGAIRETLLIQAGLPLDKIINFRYAYAPTRHIAYYCPPHPQETRGCWGLDKARSLVLQATCIKACMTTLPEYASSCNVTKDLLNLIEVRRPLAHAADMYLIDRRPKTSDDFAHSLNYAAVGIYHVSQEWPDLSSVQHLRLTEEQLRFAAPPRTWQEEDL